MLRQVRQQILLLKVVLAKVYCDLLLFAGHLDSTHLSTYQTYGVNNDAFNIVRFSAFCDYLHLD